MEKYANYSERLYLVEPELKSRIVPPFFSFDIHRKCTNFCIHFCSVMIHNYTS